MLVETELAKHAARAERNLYGRGKIALGGMVQVKRVRGVALGFGVCVIHERKHFAARVVVKCVYHRLQPVGGILQVVVGHQQQRCGGVVEAMVAVCARAACAERVYAEIIAAQFLRHRQFTLRLLPAHHILHPLDARMSGGGDALYARRAVCAYQYLQPG